MFTVEDVEGTFNGYLTADGSTPEEIGMVLRECELISTAAPGSVYLGRPWKDYGATTFINCKMGAHIHPAGWAKWRREKHHETCRYAEYGSTGPGASPDTRCSFSRQLTFAEMLQYSVNKVLGGEDGWDPRY
jgi:pectinesterase